MRYEMKGGSFPVVVCSLDSGEQMITEKGSMVWMSPKCFPKCLLERVCSKTSTLHRAMV